MSTLRGSADKVERNSFRFPTWSWFGTWMNGMNSVLLFALVFFLPSFFITAAEFAAEAEEEITEENLDDELDRLEKEIDADIATEE